MAQVLEADRRPDAPGTGPALIVDNYATHKHPKVLAWLAKHPRFHLHFTPTSSSWLNLIERWFRNLTERRLRRGVFRSVAELEQAIQEYADHHNQDPRGFRWTKSADQILAKIARARNALDKTPSVGEAVRKVTLYHETTYAMATQLPGKFRAAKPGIATVHQLVVI